MFSNSNFASAFPDGRIFLSTNGGLRDYLARGQIADEAAQRRRAESAPARAAHLRADAESLSDFAVFGGGFKQHAFDEIAVVEREQVFFGLVARLSVAGEFCGFEVEAPGEKFGELCRQGGKGFRVENLFEYTQSNTCFARNFSNPAAERLRGELFAGERVEWNPARGHSGARLRDPRLIWGAMCPCRATCFRR